MKTYTLHVAADAAPGDPAALERAVLVRDGFSFGAFVFSFFWFFAHRLWIAGMVVLAAAIGLGLTLRLLGVGSGATFSAEFLLAILVGLEASSLRRWTLARRRRPAVDAVLARDADEAEAKAFARWLAPSDERPPLFPYGGPVHTSAYRRPEPVIGLFPEADRVR